MSLLQALLAATAVALAAGQCYRKDLAPEHKPEYVKTPQPHTYTSAKDLPSTFTWQNVSGQSWLTPLLNQHIPVYCGGCWLHGSTAVLNDRLNIVRRGVTPQIMLARQVVLNCGTNESSDHYAGSCQGGTDQGVYNYMMKEGLPDETCQQYDATDHECSALRTCMNCDNKASLKPGQPMCYPVTQYGKFFATEYGTIPTAGDDVVHNIKAEVFRRGPISCGVDSSRSEEGRYHRGEIIADTKRPQDGKAWETDHVVSIVGWDVSAEGVEYWIVRNSWGRYWGEDGFVKIATGKSVMNIEESCAWVVIGAKPVTDIYGPSDSDRIFPSKDVAPLSEDGYQQVLTSKFQPDDDVTFIRRIVKEHNVTLDYAAPAIFKLAASPPATYSALVAAVLAVSCDGDSGNPCGTAGTLQKRPVILAVGAVAAIAALAGFVMVLCKRARRARHIPRVPLNPADQTEVA